MKIVTKEQIVAALALVDYATIIRQELVFNWWFQQINSPLSVWWEEDGKLLESCGYRGKA